MCGRYTLTTDKGVLAKVFNLKEELLKNLTPRYNIAPSQAVPVLIKEVGAYCDTPLPDFFRWGLIPSWAKDRSIGNKMFNARKESLTERPSFRGLLGSRRCLILADGFYEWRKEGLHKTPYHIRLKSRMPFGFAGLWSYWLGPDGSEIYSCAIVTGEPNEVVQPIHHRMPVILKNNRYEGWLDPKNQDAKKILPFLETYPAEEMEAYPVSRLINSSRVDSPECCEPVSRIPLGRSLFCFSLAVFFFLSLFSAPLYAQGTAQFMRGFFNLLTGALELPKEILNSTFSETFPLGIVEGIINGTVGTLTKIAGGVYDMGAAVAPYAKYALFAF